MAVTRQLYELQELDDEIELEDNELKLKTNLLGKREVLDATEARLKAEEQKLADLRVKHRNAEIEVDDILNKIAAIEEQLYGGKITNPKELSGLQHEVTTMKAHSDQLENDTLGIIDEVEAAEKSVSETTEDLKRLEKEWQREQEQLSDDIEKLRASLAGLKSQRDALAAQIDAATLALYDKIRQQKKQAVAKVEQGICRACRISLSASALQRARGGQPVQCGTCGRILYIS